MGAQIVILHSTLLTVAYDESAPLNEVNSVARRSIQLFKVLLSSSQLIYNMQDHLSLISWYEYSNSRQELPNAFDLSAVLLF
jgi:hypothetical protein